MIAGVDNGEINTLAHEIAQALPYLMEHRPCFRLPELLRLYSDDETESR